MPVICAIICSVLISVFIAWLLIMCYLGEVNLFAGPSAENIRYHQNEKISVLALLGMLFASFSIVENSKSVDKKINKIYIYLYTIVIGLIYVHSFYTPNVYSSYFNTHHFNAYFNSVYSSYMSMPRTSLNTGVYGYYGFILAYLMLGIKRKALYNPLYICIGFLLMILSIIWNFETGVVYSMSVIAFFIVLVMKKYKLNQKRLYYMIAVLLVAFILLILAALGLTGLIIMLVWVEI